MGTVQVTLTGDEQRLLAALDKIVQKERELARSAADVGAKSARAGEESARGGESILKNLRGMDRSFGQLLHLGKSVLGVLGISGGIAGAVSLIRSEMERAAAASARMATEVIKGGKEAAPLAGLAPTGQAGATIAQAQALAAKYRKSPAEVQAKLVAMQRETGSLGGAFSQVERQLLEEAGGPEALKRLAAGELPSVTAGLKAQELAGKAEAERVLPVTAEQKTAQAAAIRASQLRKVGVIAARRVGWENKIGGEGEREEARIGAWESLYAAPRVAAWQIQRGLVGAEMGVPEAAAELPRRVAEAIPQQLREPNQAVSEALAGVLARMQGAPPLPALELFGVAARNLDSVAALLAAAARDPR